MSLELQLWWRDHQASDLRRRQDQQHEQHQQTLRQQALAKLTPEERQALGI